MQSLTLNLDLDDQILEDARARAQAEHTTLDAVMTRLLAEYARREQTLREYDAVVQRVCGTVTVGRKLTRDEMNER